VKTFKNFLINENLTDEQKSLSEDFNVLFISDEGENDWYECQKMFKSSSWKVLINDCGVVVSFSKDASSMFPANLNVVEVEDIPEGLNISGEWHYDFDKSAFKENYSFKLESQREALIAKATSKMTYLLQAKEDGDITNEEDAYLTAMKDYRAALRRMELQGGQSVDWPTEPQSF